MTDMNYLYTIGGYATLFGVGYAVYHVSTQQQARKRGSASKTKTAEPEPRKEDRKKKQRLNSFAQAARETASKPVETPAAQPEVAPAPAASTADEGKANREFAKQLAKAKEGTKFAAKSDGKQREKSVKQSKASQLQGSSQQTPKAAAQPAAESVSAETQSSDNSYVEVDHSEIPTEAGRVDDMLEPKQAGPSVLRLTESTAPKKENKKKAKTAEKPETKKQRQNRKKAEAAKAARDDAEVERKALEEKQRRAARIADGRPAKDGSTFVASNAWKPSTNGAATNGLHEPLDTFDAPSDKQQKAEPKAVPAQQPQATASNDDDSEWSTVTTKSKKKATSNSEPVAEKPEAATKPAPAAKPAAPAPKAKAPVPANASFGAFSALTTGDDEEEEEEWDV